MISRPYFSLRKAFTYVLLIASLAPLIFISQFLTSRISDQLLSQKEHQIQNAVSTIAQEIVVELDRIQQSLNWLSRDRFNIQALDNILYSSVVTHNLVRFSELSGLINSVYILNDKWEPLYDLNGRPYHFENSQLLREISVDKSIYEQGLTKAHFYTESNLIKGIHTAKGIALVTPMLAYNLEGSGRYRASGYVVVLISFDTIEQSFQHFLLKDESFNLSQHLDTHENVKSEMTESGILERIFVLNNSSFSSPLALDITYQFSDMERLKEIKSSLLALFTVIGWTFVTVLFIAMGITRWISKEFVGMEDTIVSYASNKEVKDRTFQFSEFDRMALVLSKMSITIRNQLNELKNKNDELNNSKKVIERSNRKLSNFNQELEVQVSKQTAQLSDALCREELNKNNLAAVIEFGSIYKTLSYRELPQKVECQLQHLFSDTQWQLRFKPLGDKKGIQILSSKDKFLASLRFESSPQLEANQLVFKLFVKQLSSWLELVDIARSDALVQCGNRKAFDEDLAHYQKRYRDSKAEWNFGLFILDVNGLKAINDQYGHDLGDELIRTSSYHISALLSENDSFYRIGGDEFALLTKGMTRKECTHLAEQLQASQESLKFFDKEGKAYDAHYSIGWSCSDNTDLFKMFTIADESMYQDKREYYLHL
ncbi:GGDEF domain-containing protein [Aliivibrio sp. S4TY2]|uniref:GGDEF domain-containing protein n=1 Tax=unclassified Aliivibrio TaxID=2645654 RepID=UPI002377E252|nr:MULTISPECIES: GGDEF domain-containing protein [unclassified Aliivibrio]MDD9155078.1 GGDEF domain-containing protein [Aliivibrio sp. S4TY2]MDD9159369.1 GGDEF domain-containing protein [Aliivibrio sp. S4TY1]MDD9163081.1 GGDEF domain-containing protein [Aliivibrio sp. S4MY2]MDD9167369.1 GGDEF domain-containing protein [Aliivibrio sp. S4MY4]MDD9184158.1 GGDEF domain-containing protein [Aliivibrio sp. S4MY3]